MEKSKLFFALSFVSVPLHALHASARVCTRLLPRGLLPAALLPATLPPGSAACCTTTVAAAVDRRLCCCTTTVAAAVGRFACCMCGVCSRAPTAFGTLVLLTALGTLVLLTAFGTLVLRRMSHDGFAITWVQAMTNLMKQWLVELTKKSMHPNLQDLRAILESLTVNKEYKIDVGGIMHTFTGVHIVQKMIDGKLAVGVLGIGSHTAVLLAIHAPENNDMLIERILFNNQSSSNSKGSSASCIRHLETAFEMFASVWNVIPLEC